MLKITATDEAGYGPPLGPLIITATEWNADSDDSFPLFIKELEKTGFTIGDSKKIYHSGGSLKALESVVLGALKTLQTGGLMPCAHNADAESIESVAAVFNSDKNSGVRLCGVRCRIIEPAEFNTLLDKEQSKGTLLSEATMQLIRRENCTFDYSSRYTVRYTSRYTSANFAGTEITNEKIICDKHGGRNKYLALLQHYYPDEMFSIECESTAKSIYKNNNCKNRNTKSPLEISFIAKGESEIPVALSSMFSKYFRETAMLRFNAFWRQYIPELKPTAGYPEDAVRFLRDIREKQAELGIPDNEIRRRK